MELGVNDKLAHIEETLSNNIATSRPNREDKDGRRQQFQLRVAKLELPRYAGNDPTEWFNHIDQFYEYQGSTEDQKVVLASFHLEGEANQWWQWLRKSYQEEG
ncbi:hypothetical protein KPL71_024271 [Citrus sinensis]|uniref:Uncharacterized protein n=1 Tax=Citrus sinensis TaxID=2711 RepID=A0ACB8ISD5_CITSI|nr:hypothetical protein KPL71_024271 [Citrus sinensis]